MFLIKYFGIKCKNKSNFMESFFPKNVFFKENVKSIIVLNITPLTNSDYNLIWFGKSSVGHIRFFGLLYPS